MEKQTLKKEISLFGACATVMGTVIGAGVFFKTAAVVQYTQSASLTIFAWVLGGLLTICAGLTVAELAAAIPQTGGAVKYIEHTYGKMPGFLLGWAQSIVYFPANIAALAIIFSTQLLNLFHLSTQLLIPIALLAAVSITGINLLGTKVAARVQSITLIIKLIPVALIVIFGLFTSTDVHVSLWPIAAGENQSLLTGLSGALLATMFAYDGWMGVGTVAQELKRPEKDLPKAIFWGLAFITLVYALINVAFLKALPIEQIAGNADAASQSAQVIFGPLGGKLITLGILISVYGALNGYTMTGIRVSYALALDKNWPFSQHFAKLSKKYAIPFVSALFQLVVASIMICLGNFDLLTDMLIFVMWSFSLLLFLAVFILRKKDPQLVRPYRVPLYPVIPLIALFGGAFIIVTTLFSQPLLALTGVGLTLIGIPVFLLTKSGK